MKLAATILGVLLLTLGAVWYLAARQWRRTTDDFVARLTAPALGAAPAAFHLKDLEGLPAPVARYLRTVLPEGRPLIRVARLSQHGTFLFRPTPDGWRPFVSTEYFTSVPPGFVWDARIRVMPGVDALVRDAVAGAVPPLRAARRRHHPAGGRGRVGAAGGPPAVLAGNDRSGHLPIEMRPQPGRAGR